MTSESSSSESKNNSEHYPLLEHAIPSEDIPGGSEKILLVDDDPTTLQVNALILKGVGYDVTCVPGGEEAVESVKQTPVDLLVLDIIMYPGIDCVETYRSIKKIYPNQKAIILSGYAHASQISEAQKMGAGEYLVKPAPADKLAHAVRHELDK